MAAQVAAVDGLDVHAADGDAARGRLVQPLEQVHHRGLAAARAAQHGRRGACRDGEAHVLEDGHAVIRVGKAHMVEHDIAVQVGLEGVGLVRFGLRMEDLLDAAHGDHGLAHVAERPPQGADGPQQHADIAGEDDQLAHGDLPAHGKHDAHQQGDQVLDHGQRVAAGPVDGAEPVQPQPFLA